MGWAWLEVISVCLSLTSLVVTGVWYNKEPGPRSRIFSAILLTLTAAIFRAVVSRIVKLNAVLKTGFIQSMLVFGFEKMNYLN